MEKTKRLQAAEAVRDRAWKKRDDYTARLDDVYTYCLPMRRGDIAQASADKIFDMTSLIGTMWSAQNLKSDLSPSGSQRVEMEAGPLAKRLGDKHELKAYDRKLADLSTEIDPFFQAGDFDTALEETCVDLMIAKGAIMPVRHKRDQPVKFINIPIDRIATLTGLTGEHYFMSWKQRATVEQVVGHFKNGDFHEDFKKAVKDKPEQEVTLYQDYSRLADGRWQLVAYCDDMCADFIVQDFYRTQPIAIPSYFQDPGNELGGGPLLYAMPSIMTLNKAQELALRSAAVQLLGIWGYRAGGTFNPDAISMGAGSFWPMMSTGGVLGPDVQRLDPATGRLDIARMVIEGLRDDVKQALFDNRLPRESGTPASAAEVLQRIREGAKANIGAFGRINRGLMPVIVPRVAEILFEWGYIDFPLTINEMLVTIRTRSPMQEALDAGRLQSSVNYFDLVQAVAGPEDVDEHIVVDLFLEEARKVLNVPLQMIPNENQKKKIRADKQQQQAAVTAAQFALEAQKAAPEQPAGAVL